MKVGRPKTDRADAVKVGYKLMPLCVGKIDKLSIDLDISKSEVIERAVERYNEKLPIQVCRCGQEFKSRAKRDLCIKCEQNERLGRV